MAYNSNIEWTDHTFNGWHGCAKISPGCQYCYAETLSKRWGKHIWGIHANRQILSDANWKKPLIWNSEAKKVGRMFRVFAFSMGDVFEERPDLDEPRLRFFELVEETPNLMWLILTKRPDLMNTYTPHHWQVEGWPANTCAMTSVENQKYADIRRGHLEQVPARYKAVSYEPALGLVDWTGWELLNWLICGGESGHKARPMHSKWALQARDWAIENHVAFMFKQWGAWTPHLSATTRLEFDEISLYRVGKKRAGRLLDGRTWDEHPFDLELNIAQEMTGYF